MTADVLIIHNRVETDSSVNPAFALSNAGLLEEVSALSASLDKLGISYSIAPLSALSDLPAALDKNREPVIFNLVEEFPASIQSACYVPAICRLFNRTFTGSDSPALLLAQNKWHCKAVLASAGIAVAPDLVLRPDALLDFSPLPAGRYIVKPVFSDASEAITPDSVVDISPTSSCPAAVSAVKRIHNDLHQPAIIEQFISSGELNVSVIETACGLEVLPIAAIDFSAFSDSQPKIVDYAAKWQSDSFGYNNTNRIIPAPLPASVAATVRQYAISAFKAIGCNDYIRIDFRLDESGKPFVIEVNPNPDISPDAGFAAALQAGRLSYENFVQILFDTARKRSQSL